MIRLESVSKVYRGPDGPVHALRDATLTVERGEFVAVQGPSGSGKSTLLALVGGLTSPTSGELFVADQAIHDMTGRERTALRARKIGFVFQMFHLVPYLSVLENVLVPLLPENRSTGRKRALELLDEFQLSGRLKHRPDQLSIGERQRVAIARALINNPSLLLADEPTGNLDADNAAGVMGLLAGFHSSGGTVVLVTHEEIAARGAQRTIRLRDGRIESSVGAADNG